MQQARIGADCSAMIEQEMVGEDSAYSRVSVHSNECSLLDFHGSGLRSFAKKRRAVDQLERSGKIQYATIGDADVSRRRRRRWHDGSASTRGTSESASNNINVRCRNIQRLGNPDV